MPFEIELIKGLQSGRNDFFDVFFSGYAYLASVWAVILISILIFFLYNKKVGFAYAITEGFAFLTTFVLKKIIQRPRPFVAASSILNLGHESGYSFPSGHLTCAIVTAIFLFYIAHRSFNKKWKIILTDVCAVLFILLMMLDRMYLGVHYLTDTLAGIAVGGIWCAVALVVLPPLGRVWDKLWAKIVQKHKERKQQKNQAKEESKEVGNKN